ncbi:MAG: HlyD family type I secretion periplasmic adaptor subunit [Pseudomonadota bacterium]|nr:HlyD family type I secretion periplasmic adaptor subunit [Pseudomonadota bacterium]
MLSRLEITPKTDEQAFLPAVLEVTETPPSPVARVTALSLCGLVLTAILWAIFGHVDVVAVAQGQLVPTGRVKVIQAPELSKIKDIHVKDGQHVSAGDTLVSLEAADARADVDRLERERVEAVADIARLRALLSGAAMDLPPGIPADIAERQRALLQSLASEQNARLAGLEATRAQLEAEQKTLQTEAEKLDLNLPLIRQKTEAHEALAVKGSVSKLAAVEQRQILNTAEYDRRMTDSRLAELAAKYDSLQENIVQQEADFRSRTTADLAQAEQKNSAAEQELIKARERLGRRTLTAPVSGTVQQMAVHTVGGMVQEAQELLVIVPQEDALEVRAWVENRDIGFVEAGQDVVVKLETFPYTRYGFIEGKILDVSRDAVTPPRVTGTNAPPEKPSEQTSPAGAVYAARIRLDKTTLDVDGRTVHLTPGMTLSAEIRTGQRRIISYLLSPLQKHTGESLRER